MSSKLTRLNDDSECLGNFSEKYLYICRIVFFNDKTNRICSQEIEQSSSEVFENLVELMTECRSKKMAILRINYFFC